jgi:hypothetical protein
MTTRTNDRRQQDASHPTRQEEDAIPPLFRHADMSPGRSSSRGWTRMYAIHSPVRRCGGSGRSAAA